MKKLIFALASLIFTTVSSAEDIQSKQIEKLYDVKNNLIQKAIANRFKDIDVNQLDIEENNQLFQLAKPNGNPAALCVKTKAKVCHKECTDDGKDKIGISDPSKFNINGATVKPLCLDLRSFNLGSKGGLLNSGGVTNSMSGESGVPITTPGNCPEITAMRNLNIAAKQTCTTECTEVEGEACI